jgi:hypothetical protein
MESNKILRRRTRAIATEATETRTKTDRILVDSPAQAAQSCYFKPICDTAAAGNARRSKTATRTDRTRHGTG